MPTEDLSIRNIMKWEPNSLNLANSQDTRVKPTDMKESLARPIFRRSRKPFDPSELIQATVPAPLPAPVLAPPPPPAPVVEQIAVAPPTPPQTAESLQLSLKGIYSFNGVWRALFVSPSLPQGEWIGIGSDVSGWKLTKVDPNVVTISSGEQKIELKLYVDNQLNVLGSQQP